MPAPAPGARHRQLQSLTSTDYNAGLLFLQSSHTDYHYEVLTPSIHEQPEPSSPITILPTQQLTVVLSLPPSLPIPPPILNQCHYPFFWQHALARSVPSSRLFIERTLAFTPHHRRAFYLAACKSTLLPNTTLAALVAHTTTRITHIAGPRSTTPPHWHHIANSRLSTLVNTIAIHKAWQTPPFRFRTKLTWQLCEIKRN